MLESTCPWCEAAIVVSNSPRGEDQCPECLTTWQYEEDEVALPLAA